MAAPLTKRQTDGHRDSIETAKLIKAVQDYVLGGEGLDADRAANAHKLLDRTMPKLAAIEQTIEVEGGLTISVVLGE
jgi:hypothetical protein